MSRKLDVAIARALGFKIFILAYSSDGNAMLELGKEMLARGWGFKLFSDPTQGWAVTIWRVDDQLKLHCAVADTMPLAVALAAYKALTGKDWEEGEQP